MSEFAPKNIKRIRWLSCDKDEVRLYRFSRSLMKAGRNNAREFVDSPRKIDSMTEQGTELVNTLIGQHGIKAVELHCHEVWVTIFPIFDWSDGYHDFVIDTLNWTLFDGVAEIQNPEKSPAA